MKIEDAFTVPASIAEAWSLLNDVPRVVPCMPGAELTEVVAEDRWKARVHVKVGPVGLQFDADIEREDRDETAHRVVLAAKAREARGRGAAQARIESRLEEMDGSTVVTIETDLTLQGSVAQYGRGIVADISSQLTSQFAECLAAKLSSGLTAQDAPPRDGRGVGDADAAPDPGSKVAAGSGADDASQVKPVGGMRLAMRAVWRRLSSLFRVRR